MKESPINFKDILVHARTADVTPLRSFLLSDPSRPLLAAGSGGAASVADFAALLYGARGGVSSAVTPYTLNSFSDEALKTSKLLLVSKGGHNNDIVCAAKRGLSVNPSGTASFTLSTGDRNEVRKAFLKAGSALSFDIPVPGIRDGFVSTGTPVMYFALLCRAFDPSCDLSRYESLPETPYRLERNDGAPLSPKDFRDVRHYVVLHGSWGRPVAENLEGKLFESGLSQASVCDFRNYCHGLPVSATSPNGPGSFSPHRPGSSSLKPGLTPLKPPSTFLSAARSSSLTSAKRPAPTGSPPGTPGRSTSAGRCGCRSWRR